MDPSSLIVTSLIACGVILFCAINVFVAGTERFAMRADEWKFAIMPFAPWPVANAYYDDDVTPGGWDDMLARAVSTDLQLQDASDLEDPASWVPDGARAIPRTLVATSVAAVAASFRMSSGPFTVERSWQSLASPKRWAWSLVGCFYRSGRARAWCAKMTMTGDASDPDPSRWVFGVMDAESVGTLIESGVYEFR